MIFELNLDGQKILIKGTNEIRSLAKRKNELEDSIENLTNLISGFRPKSYKDIEKKLEVSLGKRIDDDFKEFVIVINKLRSIVYND